MEEIWKDVVGHEGRYKVSNMGNVYSSRKRGMLKPYPDKDGYLRVGIGSKTRRVHQLVYEAFYGPLQPNDNLVVDHINSNRQDNRAVNLRLLDNVENAQRGRIKQSGLPSGVFKTSNGGYMTQIYVNRGNVAYLGCFPTIDEAAKVYADAVAAKAAGGQIKAIRRRFPIDAEGYKVCTCCGEKKPVSAFFKQGPRTTGKCKKCLVEHNKAMRHLKRLKIK